MVRKRHTHGRFSYEEATTVNDLMIPTDISLSVTSFNENIDAIKH